MSQESKKLDKVAPEGQSATNNKTPKNLFCTNCKKENNSKQTISCEKCMFEDLSNRNYCAAICALEEIEFKKRKKKDISISDPEKLPLKLKLKLIRLVGERPLVNICLNGKVVDGLWDTGSMISLISRDFLEEHFPGVEIHSLQEFMKNESLNLTAANNSEVKVDGVSVLNFGIEKNKDLFEVPFLITSENISKPILGYNIIEYFVTNFKDEYDVPSSLVNILKSLTTENAVCMVNLIEAGDKISEISSEAILQKTEKIQPGCVQKIRCKVKHLNFSNCQNKPILFSPFEELCLESDLVIFDKPEIIKMGKKLIDIVVYNPSSTEILVSKGTVMGQVSDVASAYTLPIFSESQSTTDVNEIKIGDESDSANFNPQFDLSHLDAKEKEISLQMLNEEKEVFSKTKNDIGHIKDFKLKIDLMDNVPVTEAYRRIPKNLYLEVKHHISNLLTNGWIKESHSPYSSPMVCVRKKDGGLRLCIDFRKLNKKTIPDKHPIPRIQDILDDLGGNSWFSTLDMSQANHQGEIDDGSRKFTAF